MFVRPVEEIPPDDEVASQEKTDIHGRTIARLEDEIARAWKVFEIAATYGGSEGAAKRLDEMRRNIISDETYLRELKNRPDHWPRDGCEALAYSMERVPQTRRKYVDNYNDDEGDLQL